jgi:hypothetical protein
LESANRAILVVGGEWVKAYDVDIPSWKGRRGRLATAKECRRKTLDAISAGRERDWCRTIRHSRVVNELHTYRMHVGGHGIQFLGAVVSSSEPKDLPARWAATEKHWRQL